MPIFKGVLQLHEAGLRLNKEGMRYNNQKDVNDTESDVFKVIVLVSSLLISTMFLNRLIQPHNQDHNPAGEKLD